MVRCVVKTRRMIFVVKNYQVNVPIFCRVQLVSKNGRSLSSCLLACLETGPVPAYSLALVGRSGPRYLHKY